MQKIKDILNSAVGEKVIGLAQPIQFKKGDLLLASNESQNNVYYIKSGIARSYYIDENGNSITKSFLQAGEFLDGEALFSDVSLEAFDAIEDMDCLKFNAEKLKSFILADEELQKMYIEELEATIRYKMRREYGFQSLTAKQRYLEFKDIYGNLEQRIPQSFIAFYIGITKESLSRIRKSLN